MRYVLNILLGLLSLNTAFANPCTPTDLNRGKVPGIEQCLMTRYYGEPRPDYLLVWLHGDVGKGGPADYHFRYAEQFVQQNPDLSVGSVGMLRPGYPDSKGNYSSVGPGNEGRLDSYTLDNIREVAAAVDYLKDKHQVEYVILIGHSGGAAISAVILSDSPDTASGAILVACPCDLVTWVNGRNVFKRSENPLDWVEGIPPDTPIVAITGEKDNNTFSELGRIYVAAARQQGANAHFREAAKADHNNVMVNSLVGSSIRWMIEQLQ